MIRPRFPESDVRLVETWHFRMLGGFEGTRGGISIPRFRSKTSRALLAYMALAPGREFSRAELAATFWPDSDGDRQQQSVRRSLTDIRQVLEGDEDRGRILVGKREFIGLAPSVTTDVQEFQAAIRRLRQSGDDRLELLQQVVNGYPGGLLPGHPELCFANPRLELEELYASAVQELCRLLAGTDPRAAIRVGRAATVLAPYREDIQIATMEACLAAGLTAEALRQFEEWERTLDEVFGETPSEAAYRILDAIPREPRERGERSAPALLVTSAGASRRHVLGVVEELSRRGTVSAAIEPDLPPVLLLKLMSQAKTLVILDPGSQEAMEWLAGVLELAEGAGLQVTRVDSTGNQEDLASSVLDAIRSPAIEPVAIELSAGAVPLDSRFYIQREADRELSFALSRREGVILLQGPRQIGKTSLLARALGWVREQGHIAALCDFQSLSASQLGDEDRLYRSLAHRLARDLRATTEWADRWNDWLGPNDNLDEAVERILASTDRPVFWAFDEADRLFGQPYSDDLFGLIRGWHNRRALEPHGPWARLTIMIAYATEAHLFIRDLNQSPFNVGVRIEPKDFDLANITGLNGRYGSPLRDCEELEHFFDLIGGQPYLVRRGFDWLVSGSRALSDLEHSIGLDSGPFADHLRRLAAVTQTVPEVWNGIVSFLQNGTIPPSPVLARLVSGGVLARTPSLRFRSPLYRSAFSAIISQSSLSSG